MSFYYESIKKHEENLKLREGNLEGSGNGKYILLLICCLNWGNLFEIKKKHPLTQLPLSQMLFFISTAIARQNLQMSDACSLQFRRISCLVQSQCCQLILHFNVSYVQLQFRHDSPFHMDWLCPCLRDTRNKEEYLD